MRAAAVDDQRRSGSGAPLWTMIVTELLCLFGVAASVYLTYAHYSSASVLACPDKGFINCAKVTTSSYSVIAGVPVSDAGLAFFVVMLALCSPWAWRSVLPIVRWVRLAASVVGVGMILWLIYVELFRLDNLCLWCTSVHVVTVLLFFAVAFGTAAATAIAVPDEG